MIVILSAMPEELEAIAKALDQPRSRTSAGREITEGTIGGHRVAIAFSRWGKVAAASTASHLLTDLKPASVVFTGIAGALRDELMVGDTVFAQSLYQHDLDASPFFPPTHVPLLNRSALPTDQALTEALRKALLESVPGNTRGSTATAAASERRPRIWLGDIATGDQVIGTKEARERVLKLVPEALCVEMEGAAVAQVCHEFGVPFACARMISDRADESLSPAEVFELARRSGTQAAAMLHRWLDT